MLTNNLWTIVGLANGASGTIIHFMYLEGYSPPHLPTSVVVQFDEYKGPSFIEGMPKVFQFVLLLHQST